MMIYLVWVRVSYCDYGVLNIFDNRVKANEFIDSGAWKKHVTSCWELDNDDLWIEERELGKPVKLDY